MPSTWPALRLEYGLERYKDVAIYWQGYLDARIYAAIDHINQLAWADKAKLASVLLKNGDLQLQFTVQKNGWIPEQLEQGQAYIEPTHGDSWTISYSGILTQPN